MSGCHLCLGLLQKGLSGLLEARAHEEVVHDWIKLCNMDDTE